MTFPSTEPDAADVAAIGPDLIESDAIEPGAIEPDLIEPDVIEPDAIEPEVIELDVRGLPAPEPMVRILEALDRLRDGQALLARTPCHPRPLLDRLARMGFRADVVVEPAGDARVLIVCSDGATGA